MHRSGPWPAMVIALLGLAACSSHHRGTLQAPSTATPVTTVAQPVTGTTPTTEDPISLPPCSSATVGITDASLTPGVTGGGDAVEIHLRSRSDCYVGPRPILMILDTHDRLVSVGAVDLPAAHTGIPASQGVRIEGEWRAVCGSTSSPFRVRVLIQNFLLTAPATSEGPPGCFIEGTPSTPTPSLFPSGYLTVSLLIGGV